jgi:hypothetical protein
VYLSMVYARSGYFVMPLTLFNLRLVFYDFFSRQVDRADFIDEGAGVRLLFRDCKKDELFGNTSTMQYPVRSNADSGCHYASPRSSIAIIFKFITIVLFRAIIYNAPIRGEIYFNKRSKVIKVIRKGLWYSSTESYSPSVDMHLTHGFSVRSVSYRKTNEEELYVLFHLYLDELEILQFLSTTDNINLLLLIRCVIEDANTRLCMSVPEMEMNN